MDKENLVKSIVIGSIFAIVFVVVITILGDLNLPIKNWLAQTFSHHWIGKSVLSVVVFAAITLLTLIIKLKSLSLTAAVWTLTVIANTAAAILLTFFVLEAP